MRGYAVPQIFFALESHINDIANNLEMDPIEVRVKNFIKAGHVDPISKVKVNSIAILDCIEKGKTLIKWDEKKKQYAK